MKNNLFVQLSMVAILSGCQAGLWPKVIEEISAPAQRAVANINSTPHQTGNWPCMQVPVNSPQQKEPHIVYLHKVEVVIPEKLPSIQNLPSVQAGNIENFDKMFSDDLVAGMKSVCGNNKP